MESECDYFGKHWSASDNQCDQCEEASTCKNLTLSSTYRERLVPAKKPLGYGRYERLVKTTQHPKSKSPYSNDVVQPAPRATKEPWWAWLLRTIGLGMLSRGAAEMSLLCEDMRTTPPRMKTDDELDDESDEDI